MAGVVSAHVIGSHVLPSGVVLSAMNDGQQTYAQRVKALLGSSLIAHWPLWDKTGTTATEIANGNNGTYVSATLGATGIGDGNTAISNPVNGRTNIYSAGLASLFNSQELTIMGWCKMSAVGAWTDGLVHTLVKLGADSTNNFAAIYKANTNNLVRFAYIAGGNSKIHDVTLPSYTGWMHLAMTVSKSGDIKKSYINGSSYLPTGQNALGAYAGTLANTHCGIGSWTGSTGTYYWSGSLAHVMLMNRVATPTEIAKIAAGVNSPRGILWVGDSKTIQEFQIYTLDALNVTPFYQWAELPVKVGIGGIGAANMAARVASDIAAMDYPPTEIILNLGANDFATIGDGSTWKTNMTAIITAYHTAFTSANIRIVKAWSRGYAAEIAIANARIDEMYASYTWLRPGFNENILAGGDDGATYTTDGVHYSAAGLALIGAAAAAIIGT